MECAYEQDILSRLLQLIQLQMGTSIARQLTCDRPASYLGGDLYSYPLVLVKPVVSNGLMSLMAQERFHFNLIHFVSLCP